MMSLAQAAMEAACVMHHGVVISQGSEKHTNGYCERVAGTCGIEGDYVCDPLYWFPYGCGKPSRRLIELTDKEEDECADFRFFTSLTAEGKKNSLELNTVGVMIKLLTRIFSE